MRFSIFTSKCVWEQEQSTKLLEKSHCNQDSDDDVEILEEFQIQTNAREFLSEVPTPICSR